LALDQIFVSLGLCGPMAFDHRLRPLFSARTIQRNHRPIVGRFHLPGLPVLRVRVARGTALPAICFREAQGARPPSLRHRPKGFTRRCVTDFALSRTCQCVRARPSRGPATRAGPNFLRLDNSGNCLLRLKEALGGVGQTKSSHRPDMAERAWPPALAEWVSDASLRILRNSARSFRANRNRC
jgi:hypothetical protein